MTIIGIPVAIVLAKSLSTYLNPVNKICVTSDVRAIIARQKAEAIMQKHAHANTKVSTNKDDDGLRMNLPH